ncbi:MAG TPA: glycine oxidase ThiO [Rhizomicrobium sp.]|nr:glycine oxidase ThiO [Rhizomicrobium sp.]
MKITVIGGGVAGLSIGWKLALHGADVTVLERASAGHGATWAAAGMIAASAESAEAGPAEATFCAQSARMWPDFAREIEEHSGKAISYRKDGVLIAAMNAAEAQALRTRAPSQFISASDARAIAAILREDIAGGLWDPDEAQVDNRALGAALALAFQRAGGTLSVNEAAVRIEMEGKRAVAARTPFKVYFADAFVLAAGAWTSQIAGLPDGTIPEIAPVKGEMISLQPRRGAQLPSCLLWGNGVYMAPRHGRLFVGATVEEAGFDTSLSDSAREFLFDRAKGLCPALGDWEIAEHWAGLRPRAPDRLPVLGASAVENVFVASGQFRNGILMAPIIAETMAALILNQPLPTDISAFAPGRFAP